MPTEWAHGPTSCIYKMFELRLLPLIAGRCWNPFSRYFDVQRAALLLQDVFGSEAQPQSYKCLRGDARNEGIHKTP